MTQDMTADTERERAERAMRPRAAQDADDASVGELDWPPAAQRIARARERAGLTHGEVAERIDVNSAWYWDIESFDDEAFTVLSLKQLATLAGVLGVDARALLLGDDVSRARGLAFGDISRRLAERLQRDRLTVDQFGDAVGWDLAAVLTDPESLWEFNVDGFFAIAEALEFDWVAALPPAISSSGSTQS
jgi:transcriptional regulator with XRE-family HTH domain